MLVFAFTEPIYEVALYFLQNFKVSAVALNIAVEHAVCLEHLLGSVDGL